MSDMVCCPLSTWDYDGPKFYSDCIRTARKPHKCSECDEVIPPGAKYEYVSGKWDDIQVFKTCASCVEIRTHFAKGCDGRWTFGYLWSDLQENFFPDMKAGGPCMEGLSPEAKGRLFEKRLKWLEDNA